MSSLDSFLRIVSGVVAPRVCPVCECTLSSHEDAMCMSCYMGLPRVSCSDFTFNELHFRIGRNHVVDRAAAWFYYTPGTDYTHLILGAKYGKLHRLARQLGSMCAEELSRKGFFSVRPDLIVPAPLHFSKLMNRGFNQCYEAALGVSDVTGIPVGNVLRTVRSHGVQSRLERSQRDANIAGTLGLRPPYAASSRWYERLFDRFVYGSDAPDIAGKHVLLLDDIITSGATIRECCRVLASAPAPPAAISVLTLAIAGKRI